MKRLGITLSKEIYDKLEQKSNEIGVSKSDIIKILIATSLDNSFKER